MAVARIVDLGQIDFSGPVNHLADPVEWLNTAGADGRLRYYASGFRNPFGIVIDGDLWLSTNGNSDPGFLSPDLVYKKVPLGGQGDFPPASFGFGPPHVVGTPIGPLANLGQSPSPTALAFEHQNLVPGARYYYRLCAVDKAGNVSTGAVATAVAR